MSEPLRITMDPRSKATSAELEEQQRLGLEIYGEVRRSRKAFAEVKAAQASLKKQAGQLDGHPQLRVQAENLLAAVGSILRGSGTDAMGLEAAAGGLQSVLRVVESGDRTTPQQALEVYRLSDDAAKSRIAEWEKLKAGSLAEFTGVMTKTGKLSN